MAIVICDVAPVAHLPLILGVLRKLNVASMVDTLIPPHPEHMLSCGRGVEAPVLAMFDGHHALNKVGARLDERCMLPRLQPGLTRAAVHDTHLGQMLDALFAANLNRVFGAIALGALETYTIATPWLHQDTMTISLYGAYETAAGSEAPRPASGHTKDGRADLTQVLLRLGVRGDGGLPLRMRLYLVCPGPLRTLSAQWASELAPPARSLQDLRGRGGILGHADGDQRESG